MTRLEVERRKRGWTQTITAARCWMHQSQLSLIERRRLQPTDDQARQLADLLNIPVDELLDEVPDAELAELEEATAR